MYFHFPRFKVILQSGAHTVHSRSYLYGNRIQGSEQTHSSSLILDCLSLVLLFIYLKILFIYFRLHWVFVAVCGLFLVVVRGATL